MPKLTRRFGIPSAMLAVVISLLVGLQVAFAASSDGNIAGNQLVVVARDMTALGNCTLTHGERPAGSAQFTISVSRCPAGTLIETFILSQSQAQALHKRYVLLPAKSVSAATWAETDRQIQVLIASISRGAGQVQPMSFCFSADKFTTVTGWVFSTAADTGTSTLNWHTNSDCTLYFQQNTAEVTGCGTPCNPLGWRASYSGPATNNPSVTFNYTNSSGFCPTLNHNSTVTEGINQGSFAGGNIFWQTVVNNNGFCGPSAGASYNVNFGTIS